jgi:hypothetical protein
MCSAGRYACSVALLAVLAACSKDGGEKAADGKSNGALRAPKVKTGKADLTGKCLDNYPIEKGPDGRITACAIREEMVVGDVTCAKDSRPYLFEDGTLKNCGVKDVLKAGALQCRNGVTFDKTGQIQDCFLKVPVEHAGQTCKLRVSFGADGGVKKCE